MIRLSAFADEISADLNEQIAVLQEEHIQHIELRSVWGVNVLDLDDSQVTEIKQTLQTHGIRVAAIASPIGKVPVDASFEEHLQRFERAMVLAQRFKTRYIRLFSFYPPTSSTVKNPLTPLRRNPDPASYRDEVLRRSRIMVELAQEAGLVLLHENEKEIYGDSLERNLDLFSNIESTSWRAAFDPANFLQCQEQPYPAAYQALKPWLAYVHVKDVTASGTLVPAGFGEARWPEILQELRADGYDGILALEPHLQSAGQFEGFSGPELFRAASRALQQLLQAMNWQYA
ncbi:MAG TPA: sugar phosphate isomerase/epimerase family protein [Ktedonobacteraceae bacterium]